jgi:hypothetical protein
LNFGVCKHMAIYASRDNAVVRLTRFQALAIM